MGWLRWEGCRPCNFQCDCCLVTFSRCCSGAIMWAYLRNHDDRSDSSITTAFCSACYYGRGEDRHSCDHCEMMAREAEEAERERERERRHDALVERKWMRGVNEIMLNLRVFGKKEIPIEIFIIITDALLVDSIIELGLVCALSQRLTFPTLRQCMAPCMIRSGIDEKFMSKSQKRRQRRHEQKMYG